MQKNVAGQKWIVYAFGGNSHANPGDPVTGDAANITANIRIDGGAADPVDDTNPTELEDGLYVFDLSQAETNGELLCLAPVSSTSNVLVMGSPPSLYTTPANFPDLSVTATTGRMDVDSIGGTAQTANDNGADINAILADTNELQADWANGGRLDNILDARSSQTTQDTIDANVDTIVAKLPSKAYISGSADADGGVDATEANVIADAHLNRDMSAVSDTNARSPLNALRNLRNKWSISGTTLTVTKEDDSTAAWTSTLTTDAAADPITASDPA